MWQLYHIFFPTQQFPRSVRITRYKPKHRVVLILPLGNPDIIRIYIPIFLWFLYYHPPLLGQGISLSINPQKILCDLFPCFIQNTNVYRTHTGKPDNPHHDFLRLWKIKGNTVCPVGKTTVHRYPVKLRYCSECIW